jgi:hypothetical protein
MRKSLFPLVLVLAVALLIVTLTAGCKGKAGPKNESVPFSQQTSHPGLENASSIPGKALAKAETVECQNNLQQLRASIRMDADQGQQPPASIGQGPMGSVSKCPITGKTYEYDPQTGKVWCTTSGHEKF